MSWRTLHVDFLKTQPRTPRAGWVCLALGLLVLAAGGDAYRSALHQAEARAMQAANASRQARVAAVPVPPPAFATDARWRAAARELAFPWDDKLQALEQATAPPVLLLGLNPDKRSGLLRLEAEVGQYADALAYVDRLAQGGLLGRPVLMSHEMTQDPGGRPYLRVVISVPWTEKSP